MTFRRIYSAEKYKILSKVSAQHKSELIEILKLVRVAVDRGCWFIRDDWSNYTTINGKRGHRLMYELYNGSINRKLLVCHRCDRKGCINPEHLYQGTYSDNMQDARLKWKLKKTRKYILASEESTRRIRVKYGH